MIKFNRAVRNFCLAILLLSSILILVFFLIQKISKEIDHTRIVLIDVVGNNYVFRGNNPFITKNGEKIFAYDDLTSYFNSILKQQNRSPMDEYYLIDISLLDLDEYSEIKKEQQFFITNPNLGMMMHFSTLSPSLLLMEYPSYSNFVTEASIKNYNIWVTNLLEKIHYLASQKTDKPVVIYIHCDSGRDRTGLVVTGYKMLFNNINLAKAKSQNISEAGRSSRALYDRAIKSYCSYVKEFYNKPDDYCIS
jgi:hypothetical protein